MLSLLLVAALTQSPTVGFVAQKDPEGIRFVGADAEGREIGKLRVGPLSDLLRHGAALYASLAAGGLLVVDAEDPASPVVTARLLDGRPITHLAHQGESLLVLALADRSSVALDLTDPLHPTEVKFEGPPAPASAARGSVRRVSGGEVFIAGGSEAGFRVGMHARIVSRSALSSVDRVAEQNGLTPLGSVTAVVRLTRVSASEAVGQLGRGDEASVGDFAEGTEEDVSESLVWPKRAAFNWRVEGAVRPFVNTGGPPAAAGFLMRFGVDYFFSDLPLRLGAGVEPLGFATGAGIQHNPSVAVLDVAFSTSYFELGLGGGFSTLNNEFPCQALQPCGGSQALDGVFPELRGRLGALDGLNITGRYAIGWTHGTFDFGRLGEVALNIPLSRRLTLYTEGGGGTGFSYGEAGMRVYLDGLGGRRTVIFSGGIGGARIADGAPETLAGPSLALGVELRF